MKTGFQSRSFRVAGGDSNPSSPANLTYKRAYGIICTIMSGEVLGNGYKVEIESGEETLVPDNFAMIDGISLAVERAIRVRKVAPVMARIKGLPGLMGSQVSIDALRAENARPHST